MRVERKNMVIGIFGKNMERANRLFDELIGNMFVKDLKEVTKRPFRRAILTDGTTYKVLPTNDSCRGNKIDKAYISGDLPVKFIYEVMPLLFTSGTNVEYFD